MTMNWKPLLIFILGILTFNGCTKDDLDEGLFATWQVTKVEGLYYFNNVPTIPVADTDPSGTVKFESDGTGYQNYTFQLVGNTYQQIGAFVWEADDNEIRIDRVDEPDMVWTRNTNLTNKQVATYIIVVDANSKWEYTLTLEK
jgi:hypothetical protein